MILVGCDGLLNSLVDNQPPEIEEIIPPDAAMYVPVDTDITVKFSESVENVSIDVMVGWSIKAGTIEVNDNVAVKKMDTPFSYTTVCLVSVEAEDKNGNKMQPAGWSFITEDPPTD